MSARTWSNTFRVGIYTCKMAYTERGGIKAQWTPDLPPKKSLPPHLISEYRAGRDALFAQIAEDTGSSVMVFET